MKIGFTGLGRMGWPMAQGLLAAGFDLICHARSADARDRLQRQDVAVASDMAELCRDRDLIITMLPSDKALEAVTLGANGLATHLPRSAIHMVSGTHGIETMSRIMAAHEAAGQLLVACPVLGRPDRAAEGKLGLVLAGPSEAIARLDPVLGVIGQRRFDAGTDPVAASAIKIANNFVLGCAIEAIGEGMALARRYGVDPALFQQVLTGGAFDCMAYRAYGDIIAQEDWGHPGAAATIGLKDADLAMAAAARVHVPLPSGNVWRDHLLSACGRGEADLDWAVMAREQFRRSGLE